MIKNVTLISDTDSTIISFDAWYRYILEKVKYKKLKLLYQPVDLIEFVDPDEFGDPIPRPLVEIDDVELTYDFYEDKTIEVQRTIDMCTLLPQDGLRYSIVNILAYVADHVINDYMERYCAISNSLEGPGKCLIIMKNEF